MTPPCSAANTDMSTSQAPSRRPPCVACTRPYGRRRAPLVIGQALLGCDELDVCDQCWHLAGGAVAIRAQLVRHNQLGEQLTPLLVFDPQVETLFAAASDYDALHPSDRLLVESGIRWIVLRHIAVPARIELARRVLERVAPRHTRAATSPQEWIEAVEARIREQTGTEFKYNPKRRRWWQISSVFRHCADQNRRPLTWVTQEEIAAAVGCSTRTVRRCVAWLQREGLLWEVVPGCQLPQQARSDDETAAEREERQRQTAEAIAAEEAAIARAHTELDAVQAGHPGAWTASATQLALEPVSTSTEVVETHSEQSLIRIAPVYELRLLAGSSPAAPAVSALTSENNTETVQDDQNVHPPVVSHLDQTKSTDVHPVENRRAPRDPDHPGSAEHRLPAKTSRPRSRQSEATNAAYWLLRSRLDPRICDDVSLRWLAAQIRGSHLLDRYDWTWDDLADQLHGYPEYTHLPHYIRNCRAWIRARITRATPHLSPTKLRLIQHVERHSPALQRQRQTEREHKRKTEIAQRRAAINACNLCDEQGWLHTPPNTPTARCNHDPATGGW